LPAFAKWFELVIFHRISQRLQVRNILSVDKFGFREGLSTINAIYKLSDNVLKS
jgi:hypothetical protein